LSATFGMAGGLLLMGLYTMVLPVPEAMVLHGLTQLVSNGGRAWLLRGHVHRGGVGGYVAGALVAWGVMRSIHFVPGEATVYLGIGAIPFVAALLPPNPVFDFARRGGAVVCGALVVGTQMAFGVAGPLLDVFFVRTSLLRREVVATKATTQTLSHALKIAYFAPLLAGHTEARLPMMAVATMVAAVAGTRAGGLALERMGEDTFRRWTRRLVLLIGAGYLAKGLAVVW
jgi:uncharacterized membrane protein YfcA